MKRDGMTRSEGKNPAQPGEDEIPGRRGGSQKKGACAIAKNSGGRQIAPILPVPVWSMAVVVTSGPALVSITLWPDSTPSVNVLDCDGLTVPPVPPPVSVKSAVPMKLVIVLLFAS